MSEEYNQEVPLNDEDGDTGHVDDEIIDVGLVEEPPPDDVLPEETKPEVKDEEPAIDWQARFKEQEAQLAERDKRLKDLETMMYQHRQQPVQPQNQQQQKPNFKNMADLKKEDWHTWFEEDPAGFHGNLTRQMAHEIRNTIMQELQTQQRNQEARKSYDEYAGKNPDFIQMIQDGSIQRFMDQHPGHNAISAHQALTYDQRMDQRLKELEAKHEADMKEAIKKAQQEAIEKMRAKGKAHVLSGGPAGPSKKEIDPMLKDPDKYGGTTRVLSLLHKKYLQGKKTA